MRLAMPISGKKFDLQLYGGEFSPGIQNRDLLVFNFSSYIETVVIIIFLINALFL